MSDAGLPELTYFKAVPPHRMLNPGEYVDPYELMIPSSDPQLENLIQTRTVTPSNPIDGQLLVLVMHVMSEMSPRLIQSFVPSVETALLI